MGKAISKIFETVIPSDQLFKDVSLYFFERDVQQIIAAFNLGAMAVLVLGYIDYIFFKFTTPFFLQLASRIAFLGISIAFVQFLRSPHIAKVTPAQLSWFMFTWCILLDAIILSVDYSRPRSYVQNQSIYVLTIFCLYTVAHTSFLSRAIPAILLSLMDLIMIFFIKDPMSIQATNMIVVFQILTHVVAIQFSSRTEVYRRQQYQAWSSEKKALAELEQIAKTDELTGLYNRRYFLELFQREFNRYKRLGEPFCLLMLDLDYFKEINDGFGHLKGDEVLRQFAALLKNNARQIDICGRLGGEEFAVLCPGISLELAYLVGNRIRERCMDIRIGTGELTKTVTTSIGVTVVDLADTDTGETVQRADSAMYLAKAGGRNRVETIPQLPSSPQPDQPPVSYLLQ